MGSTIKDVARYAGVSVATVSRVINNLSGYTEETRKQVLRTIEELGYTPNAIARGLVNKKTSTIGVLLPSLTSKFMNELLNGIESVAHKREKSVILCNTDTDGSRTEQYLKVLNEKQVDGIIFVSEWLKESYGQIMVDMKIPVVLVSTYTYRFNFPYIRVDDTKASYTATSYLIEKGHREIGMISGRRGDPVAGYPRIEGYKKALNDAGIPFREEYIAYGDFHYRSGVKSAEELLKRVPHITAVFATSDEMALGVLSYAYRAGISVPDELSVIGYDDTQDAEMAIPPLTTIHQPIFEMGVRAVEMLLSPGGKESVIMPYHIVERESVKSLQ
ncbi:MAG: LacI family transcriptional regulator [Spirochaetes bacterium]|nr:MAG: LacI family transcriptional regulator [Spirochaetota bacterium]